MRRAGSCTSFVYYPEWLREAKRGDLQVKRTPLSGQYVLIANAGWKGGCQKVGRSASAYIAQCLENVAKGKMNKTVTAEHKVHLRQVVNNQIHVQETHALPFESPSILLHYCLDHVCSD